MKTNNSISTFCAILASATITTLTPLMLVAQEERDNGEEVDVKEELADATNPLHKPANTWPKGGFVIISPARDVGTHLGPTGLWGVPMGQNLQVKQVDPGSPADGKVLPDDIIYGAGGKGFPADRDARYYFSQAITQAETKEDGGELVLDIRRDGEVIQVTLHLEVMGSFSATTPYHCEKSDKIVARAEEYMRKGLRPETGIPDDEKYMYQVWNDSVLFLLATGNPEMQGLVRRYMRNTMDAIDEWKLGNPSSFETHSGWGIDFMKLLLGEYYHCTGDATVLPYLEGLVDGSFNWEATKARKEARGLSFEGARDPNAMDWTWPPKNPTGYGTHPHAHIASTMGDILANEAGIQINQNKLLFDLKYLYVKRAEYGYVGYHGYGNRLIENRQIDKPEVMTEEEKNTGTFSAMNGKPGMAAAMFSMVDGYEKGVEMCSERSVYAFNRTQGGHGGIFLNGFWTPIGASHAGTEKFQHFMKGQQWVRELHRDCTGSMWQMGNARVKKNTLGTGFAIHRVIPRKNLRMLGAPHSMFGPTAPAYMKEALAAHHNRDYALAEQITLKLQEAGTVPGEDKERVNRFLKTVKMLKESIEHDLSFTEALLAKQNYVLANIELAQLQLVVSPDNPRLMAIARTIDSKKDQIPTSEQISHQRAKAHREAFGAQKNALKKAFEEEVANSLSLIKDGAKYQGPRGTRRGTFYPSFPKNELNQWRMFTVKSSVDAPQGWEQPSFDDSKWKPVTMPARWGTQQAALLRTSFEVQDVSAFTSLRVRGFCHSQSNLTIYLNGEVVAKGAEIPGVMTFDLAPSSLRLLKKGMNKLAISTHRGFNKQAGFSIRLDGMKHDRGGASNDPPKQKAASMKTKPKEPRKQPEAAPVIKTHHDEVVFMLGHLKRSDPKMSIGGKDYPASTVYDYLSNRYAETKEHVTSTDIFLNKIASETAGGLIYYVVDGAGKKVMLKNWLKAALPAR